MRSRVSPLPARLGRLSIKRQHPKCPDFGNLLAERLRVKCVAKITHSLFKIDEIVEIFP